MRPVYGSIITASRYVKKSGVKPLCMSLESALVRAEDYKVDNEEKSGGVE